MTIALSVNLNKIALLRNSRPGNAPSVSEFGKLCLDQGVQGLTVHPRPDQRHIRPGDVSALRELIDSYPGREFNVEGNPLAGAEGSYPGFLSLVEATRPHQCTLVPDSSEQLTSDQGFDLTRSGEQLTPIIQRLQQLGIRVSLFMDPDKKQIALARDIGADRIELYTGPYADSFEAASNSGCEAAKAAFEELHTQYCDAAIYATGVGLGVNAGHDLNLNNMVRFAAISGILEVSIGHALTVDALHMGMTPAVAAYLNACR